MTEGFENEIVLYSECHKRLELGKRENRGKKFYASLDVILERCSPTVAIMNTADRMNASNMCAESLLILSGVLGCSRAKFTAETARLGAQSLYDMDAPQTYILHGPNRCTRHYNKGSKSSGLHTIGPTLSIKISPPYLRVEISGASSL
ncbi:hypothetical protein WG66_005587 [Moniliophthora roreri]|nr:hypothetical protein WG66_005587 [Moniliophthora roreri]